MELNLDDVDIAVVVNVEILRQVLKNLSTNGKKWWIACEPAYAVETGLTIGYGDPGCVDRLNTVYYKVPVLNQDRPLGGPDKLVVLLDSSVVVAEQPGLYREDDCVLQDEVADIEDFFIPILRALVPVLAAHAGAQ
ncbi:hypothetical protein H7849_20345 [Alloacidobacterium dinghuense]|uniref:Uncharacterized protein n=1 Tax=Alloacidobacterium dinghuense TaxID=2763107 RepID=A0A7G8BFT3_9BACT|nr:hypothetical protein [Alloacidobacterium dinghuense]QNI31403.1 hypothetical protein H7849_20345 [Alloacidobacterium dinghuense]